MVTLKNNTNKCIRCCSRLNGRWFDGLLPGQMVECDEEHKVRALVKHGCEIVKPSVSEKVKRHKTIEEVLAEKPKKRKRKVKKKEVE